MSFLYFFYTSPHSFISFFASPSLIFTQWISRWIATARERIPGSIDNYVTGVSECSQQRGNLKDNGYLFIQVFRRLSSEHILHFRHVISSPVIGLSDLCATSCGGFLNGSIRFFIDHQFFTDSTDAGKTTWKRYRQPDRR
ncbi:hypothetical protein [Photorhabdus sp. RW14-46]|uniref:hypothetical protein n=1 Tax=Photorhabdus sp. RW14-46 TaxID=2100168 RepID=UPI001F623978|nr:hypothetical protein [Photorhabdus sp. RW14-46]